MALPRKEQFHGGRAQDRPIPPALRIIRFLFATLGPLLPGLMGRWAYRLWFRTRRFPESAAGKQQARSARQEMVTVDNIPVVVHIWGEGPVVLFGHGWSGRGSQVAAFVEPLVSAGFQVVAPDAPGHGETPGDSTNILECAATFQAVAARFGPVQGAITHSFGGMVLAYAMNNGLSVDRVVTISAPAHVAYLMADFAQTLAIPDSVIAAMQKRIDKHFSGGIWERLSTVYNVKSLTTPALIIHDVDDVSVSWEQGKMIADAWPGAQFMKTSGLGHGRILRDKQVVAAAVEFIKG
ncbi:MAG: alpha/beta fold hydrolase [Gammaproteobacteria bacterium]|nr:alpha/beta fold hydrolase [Gammaproteobacteria bacterium]